MKYFIISKPKSGTYLCSNILKILGLIQTFMHISEKYYHQYDPNNIEDGRLNPKKYQLSVPIEKSILKVPENSFAVGHLQPKKENLQLLVDFKKIFLHRNLEDRKMSAGRWTLETPRKPINFSFSEEIKMDAWRSVDNTFSLSFEDMIDKNQEKIDELQYFVLGKVKINSNDLITEALQTESLTKSSIRK